MSAGSPLAALAASRLPAAASVLFALGGESRRRFEPLFHGDALPGAVCRWADPGPAPAWEELLRGERPDVLVTGWGTPLIPPALAADASFPVRYVCHLMGTVRHIVPRSMLERGVVVSNWGGQVSFPVAEHALLLLLAALRNVPAWRPNLRPWPSHGFLAADLGIRSLRGRRVGLHGFGRIARDLARLLRPFSVKVSSYSNGVPPALFSEHGVMRCETLEELFSGSDAIVECEALTPETRGAVTEELLLRLPSGAPFVNVGRGAVVDEGALQRLAREGRLRLGIDVYGEEPLPASSPFHDLSNAVLSPHIAGPTEEGFRILFIEALENVRRFLAGETIEGRVTLEIYDRAT